MDFFVARNAESNAVRNLETYFGVSGKRRNMMRVHLAGCTAMLASETISGEDGFAPCTQLPRHASSFPEQRSSALPDIRIYSGSGFTGTRPGTKNGPGMVRRKRAIARRAYFLPGRIPARGALPRTVLGKRTIFFRLKMASAHGAYAINTSAPVLASYRVEASHRAKTLSGTEWMKPYSAHGACYQHLESDACGHAESITHHESFTRKFCAVILERLARAGLEPKKNV
jgi:hypothetical protein